MHSLHQITPYFGPIQRGVKYTLIVTFASFAAGILGGIPLVVMRVSRVRMLRLAAVAYIEILRGIPPLTWLFVLYFGVATSLIRVFPISVLTAAILTLGLITAAYMAEIYRSGIQAVPSGQWEAARALGLRERKIYQLVVFRQALATVIPPGATYLIGLLKDSALASTIGVQEITFQANAEVAQNFRGLQVFLVAAVFYVALSLPLAFVSRHLDRRLRLHLRI